MNDNRDHTTRDAILTYLRDEPRPLVQIRKYMFVMHKRSSGATRQALYVLCRAGAVERMDGRFYRTAGHLPTG